MVSDAFRDERDARVADAEALSRLAVQEDRARRAAVGDDVSCDDVSFGDDVGLGWPDRDDAAAEPTGSASVASGGNLVLPFFERRAGRKRSTCSSQYKMYFHVGHLTCRLR